VAQQACTCEQPASHVFMGTEIALAQYVAKIFPLTYVCHYRWTTWKLQCVSPSSAMAHRWPIMGRPCDHIQTIQACFPVTVHEADGRYCSHLEGRHRGARHFKFPGRRYTKSEGVACHPASYPACTAPRAFPLLTI